MVTTQLDFMHIRSTTGLARQVRRVARRMKRRNYTHKLEDLAKKVREAINSGDVNKVDKDLLLEIKKASAMDSNLALIMKDEMILLNEEEKVTSKELGYDNELSSLVKDLDDESRAIYEKEIIYRLKNIAELNRVTADKVRRILDALRGDSEAFLQMRKMSANLLGDKWSERVMMRDARKERRDIAKEEKDIDKLTNDLRKMTIFLKKGNKSEAKKILQDIVKIDKDLFKAMEDEMGFIADIVLRSALLYVHLMKFLSDLPKILEELKSTGYPEIHLAELKKGTDNILGDITKHREDLYKLGRYETGGANAL